MKYRSGFHWPTFGACGMFLLQAFACSDLPSIPANECGNGILEPPEECDMFAGSGRLCRPPDATKGACRFDCTPTDSGTPACPDGTRCGVDGICRAPRINELGSSDYREFGALLPVPAHSLQIGDFDGDGRGDLLALGSRNDLWQAYPRVLFFDEAGQVESMIDPRTPISSPQVLPLSAPGDESRLPRQLVFSSAFGIGAAEFTQDRTVLPVPYPIQVMSQGWSYRVLRLRGTVQTMLNEAVLLFMSDQSQSEGKPGVIAEANSVAELAVLPKGVQYLTGPPVAANVVDSASSPCEEALFTYQDDEHVYLFEACDEVGRLLSPAAAPRAAISLPDARPIGHAPLVAFVNDDEHLDVLAADASNPGKPFVAFGQGDGTFLADPSNAASLATAWPVEIERAQGCPLSSAIDPSFPLAVGDLNADGLSDWVTRRGVQLTQSITADTTEKKIRIAACTTNTPFARQWTKAALADINADGLLDVIAGSSSGPDLDVLRGTGFTTLNPSAIATGGTLTHLATGDFDGDGITDVVFDAVQLVEPAQDRLAIAFGRPGQPPDTPIEIGEFTTIDQLQTAKYAGDDAIDEIGVIATPSDSPGQQLSVFIGSAGRHPIAPMGLEGPSQTYGEMISGVPLALTAGKLGTQLLPSLVVASIYCEGECEQRLWVVPSASTGRFGIPIPSAVLPQEFSAIRLEPVELGVHLLIGDVNADGSNEGFALTADPAGASIHLWQIALPAPGAEWSDPSPVQLLASTPGRLTPSSNPQLFDLDSDGYADLILIVDTGNGQARLGVVTNHQGSLDLSRIQYVQALDGQVVRAFATALRARRDTRGNWSSVPHLMAITNEGTFSVSTRPDSGLSVDAIDGLPGGSSIAVGNIAGYGLSDVAVGSSAGVRLFSEAPERE